MHWIAIHLPELALQVFLRGSASPEVLAVTEGRRVLAASTAAQALGVHAGLGVATAQAVAPDLVLKPRNDDSERAALHEIALWAGQFTPQISLAPPDGVLLETAASLRLFGGMTALWQRIETGLTDLGFAARIACAPTPLAAALLARAGHNGHADKSQVAAALATLPIGLLDLDGEVEDTLSAIGARSLGDCLRLPRASLARRCGPGLLQTLDRALGQASDPRPWFIAPASFAARAELGWPTESTEPVLFIARRLLAGLAGFLTARHGGIERFDIELEHEARPPTRLAIELASRGRDERRFLDVLREHLARLTLDAPVLAVRLAAAEIHDLAGLSRDLFDDGRRSRDACARLLENLRARLGDELVSGVRAVPAHRPEFAWANAEPGLRQKLESLCGSRPLWLLEPPQALPESDGGPRWDGPVALLTGPERIESGWWDGSDCCRDYYVGSGPRHELLWLFRERHQPGGWFLHGLFA
jgi:protein ImuB